MEFRHFRYLERGDGIQRMESDVRPGVRLLLLQKSQSSYFEPQVHLHLLMYLMLPIQNAFPGILCVDGFDSKVSPLLAEVLVFLGLPVQFFYM